MNNPEKLVNKRQRTPKEQSKMNNPEKLANKRQRIPKGQWKMNNLEKLANKRQRIPMAQSKMDNPEKLVKQGIQDEEKESKNTTQYVLDTTIRKHISSCVHFSWT